MILVSACLCGINCRYDGKNCFNSKVYDLYCKGKVLPVCSEQLGGLTTPRKPSEICGGTGLEVIEGKTKVINKCGNDVSKEFYGGAEVILKIAKALNIKKAILKQRSPSCGFGIIYDGTFSGNKIKGNGVTAELLKQNGIEILTEEDL